MSNLNQFKNRVEKEKTKRNQKVKEKYDYARNLGFDSVEARFLSHRSWKFIKSLEGQKG